MDLIRIDRDGAVAVVTLDRPEARNALSAALLDQLGDAFTELAGDDGVRAVVLTGADPAFCAGLDLGELQDGGEALLHSDAVDAVGALGKPLIGAINGPAVTGGLELALICDFRVASERARFADTHAQVGLIPGWGLSVRLPRAVGLAWAKQMSFTGDHVDADLALRIGLVNHVVAHDQLLDVCRGLARDVAEADVAALLRLRRLYDEVAAVTDEPALAVEQDAFRDWNAGLRYGDIGERRAAVTARGSRQASGSGDTRR